MSDVKTWQLPEVADGHAKAALQELLNDPMTVDPFRYFIEAMEFIAPMPGTTLLDAGCGAGAYGKLCDKAFPQICYTGTDFSAPMIENARMIANYGRFRVCDFYANDFSAYDIVLASSVLEYAGDFAALRFLLGHARRWVILHRLRLCAEPSHAFDEATYAGQSAPHFVWNLKEMFAEIKRDHVEPMHVTVWTRGDHATIVLNLASEVRRKESNED